MQKILITGSEGFVGQHAVQILKTDYLIIGLSRNTKLPSETNVQYIIGDLLDPEVIYYILNEHHPDIILHLAGIAKTWDNDPHEVFNINLFGTLNLYENILKVQKESNFNPKIIYVSSAEVYGKTDSLDSIPETALPQPINEYGVSKLAADRLSYQYTQSHNLNIIIARPFPHIGTGQGKGFFVPDMASQIGEIEQSDIKEEILVGNLEATRDYLDVRDVIFAYKALIETNIPPGEVFNICSSQGVQIKHLLDQLVTFSSKKIKIQQDFSKLRPLELPIYVGDNHKITTTTGWKPQYSIVQTLKDVLEYWRGKQ